MTLVECEHDDRPHHSYGLCQSCADRQRKYNLSAREYQDLFNKQLGLCAICGNPCEVVDHDHVTGLVRGLLCNTCNRALGLFGDNPSLLRKALAYLDGTKPTV